MMAATTQRAALMRTAPLLRRLRQTQPRFACAAAGGDSGGGRSNIAINPDKAAAADSKGTRKKMIELQPPKVGATDRSHGPHRLSSTGVSTPYALLGLLWHHSRGCRSVGYVGLTGCRGLDLFLTHK
jgi:hypothetical protein